MGSICTRSSAVGDFDSVAQSEILSGKHVLEFLGLKWSSKRARQLLKPFDDASNGKKDANVKVLITESLALPFEKYYYEGFLVFGNHPDPTANGGHPTGHEHCTFSQYLVSLWNICTLQRPHGIAEWMFRMEFGDERATQADVFEMFDKQYGISEARDDQASIAKAKYGANYHKKQVKKTKAHIAAYQDRTDGYIHPNGFVKLIVEKMPGMVEHHISHQMTLRESICNESFWNGIDKQKTQNKDFESIDALTAALELLHPGALVVGGDGMTGVRGKSTDGNPDDLTSEEKKERNLIKHSEEEFKQQQLKKHGVNGHGSKNAKHMEDKLHGGKGKHGHKKITSGKPMSMHERAHAAMADKKAEMGHGPQLHLHNSHHQAHHGKKSAHDHGDQEKGHHHHSHRNGGHSGHGRH